MSSVFEDQAVLLKIYVDENAWKDGQKAAEWISCRACELGLAGASVFRGIGGYCSNAPIVAPEFFDFRLARPLLIEIVDQADKIDQFAQKRGDRTAHVPCPGHGLFLLRKHYGHGNRTQISAPE